MIYTSIVVVLCVWVVVLESNFDQVDPLAFIKISSKVYFVFLFMYIQNIHKHGGESLFNLI